MARPILVRVRTHEPIQETKKKKKMGPARMEFGSSYEFSTFQIEEGGNQRTPTWRSVHVSRAAGNTSERQRCWGSSAPYYPALFVVFSTRRNFSFAFGSLSRITESG